MEDYKLEHLREALPYIRKFKKKIFVIKLSGKVAADESALDSLAEEVALFHQVGFFPVIVHGGGQQIGELSDKLGIEQTVISGRRVTNAETLDLAKMVFGGLINTNIASALRKVGVPVVGLSGLDGQMIQAVKRQPKKVVKDQQEVEVDFGFVGDIVGVDTSLVRLLLEKAYVPVISSLGSGDDGEVFNINADTIAVAIARDLEAEKLIYMTDVHGIYTDADDPTTKLDYLTVDQVNSLIGDGLIKGGMVPKLNSIIDLLHGGVKSAHIVGAFQENGLLKEIFTNHGSGTMITL